MKISFAAFVLALAIGAEASQHVERRENHHLRSNSHDKKGMPHHHENVKGQVGEALGRNMPHHEHVKGQVGEALGRNMPSPDHMPKPKNKVQLKMVKEQKMGKKDVRPKTQSRSGPELTLKLQECQGDCYWNEECDYGLVCHVTDHSGSVPGCSGNGLTMYNADGYEWYCITPENNNDPVIVYQDGDFDSQMVPPLPACAGDCDSDSDCGPGLLCYERGGWEGDDAFIYDIPGCTHLGDYDIWYCGLDESIASPVASPTESPVAAPTESPVASGDGGGGGGIPDIPCMTKDPGSATVADEWVAAHNCWREYYSNAPKEQWGPSGRNWEGSTVNYEYVPVEWDDDLADQAQSWADYLVRSKSTAGGLIQHISYDCTMETGENLAWWPGNFPGESGLMEYSEQIGKTDATLRGVMRRWVYDEIMAEKSDGQYGWATPVIGHASMVLWSTATKIGCAEAEFVGPLWSSDGEVHSAGVQVCRYYTGGNCGCALFNDNPNANTNPDSSDANYWHTDKNCLGFLMEGTDADQCWFFDLNGVPSSADMETCNSNAENDW